MATRGMMSDSNFVGKGTLLAWINSALQLRLERVEDTCNGAVACQLLDALHPDVVNMRQVDFNLKNDYEFVKNYKELQKGFTACKIEKVFNPTALSKGKLQDNQEFMQWFYGYWQGVTGGAAIDDYDAIARRQLCRSGDWKKWSLGATSGSGGGSNATIPAVRRGPAPAAPRPTTGAKVPLARVPAKPLPASGPVSRGSSASLEQLEAAQQEADRLREQITEMKLKVETAERERDFYFDKLRDIETLCQAPELQEIPAVRIVEKILYAADSVEAKEAMGEAQQLYGAKFELPAAEVAAE